MKNVVVSTSKVSKWFGDFQALKSVDLKVHAGQRIVLCGPSGSGKSTLIRCINGLEPYQEGVIEVDGIVLDKKSSNIRSIRREVGMVFQHFNLFPHLTILENCHVSSNAGFASA